MVPYQLTMPPCSSCNVFISPRRLENHRQVCQAYRLQQELEEERKRLIQVEQYATFMRQTAGNTYRAWRSTSDKLDLLRTNLLCAHELHNLDRQKATAFKKHCLLCVLGFLLCLVAYKVMHAS